MSKQVKTTQSKARRVRTFSHRAIRSKAGEGQASVRHPFGQKFFFIRNQQGQEIEYSDEDFDNLVHALLSVKKKVELRTI